MAFTKITAELVASNEALRDYLLGAGRITAGNKGGVFVGNRDIAPDSLREFGIVLPKGGMILPGETVKDVMDLRTSVLEAQIARRVARRQRLDEVWEIQKMKIYFIYMNHHMGVVGVLEHPRLGALYVLIPTSSQYEEDGKRDGVRELRALNDREVNISVGRSNTGWTTPWESKMFVLSPQAHTQLAAKLHKFRAELVESDLGDSGPDNFNWKAFGFKTKTQNFSLEEARDVIDWVIAQI